MLLSQLGRSFRQGKHLLRVLYYRPLFNLLPGTMLRRSETHIARQIFSGLTLINEEKGEVEGDLAITGSKSHRCTGGFICVRPFISTTVVNWRWPTSSRRLPV